MIEAVLFDFGETLVERIVDDEWPLSELDIVPFPDARPALARLVAEDYRLAVVSNTSQSSEGHLRTALRTIGLGGFFEVVVTSFDVGYEKPDPRPFRRALERLACAPERAAMVGNDPVGDIGGAASLGMTTILVARAGAEGQAGGAASRFTVSSLAEIPPLLRSVGGRSAAS